ALFLAATGPRTRVVGAGLFSVVFLMLCLPLGERELVDLWKYLGSNPQTQLLYYNPKRTIFCEWGVLQLTFHRDVRLAQEEEELRDKLTPGMTIVVPWPDDLESARKAIAARGLQSEVSPWTRWWTQGK